MAGDFVKIKVCVITSSHPVFDTRIFQKECRSLVDAGFDVTLIAPAEEGVSVVEGVRVIGFGRLRSRWQRFTNLVRIGRLALQQNADVYHVHEPELLLLWLLLKIHKPRARFIYDVHEDYAAAVLSGEKYWIPKYLKYVIARSLDVYEKLMSRRVDLVVAAAPDIEQNFKGCHAISVRNFAPLIVINRIYAQAKRRDGLSGPRELIFTGSITRERGIIEVIKALELLGPDIKVVLTVAGHYHDERLRSELEGLPGFKKTEFLGWLSFEDMIKRVINADAALMCFHSDPNIDSAVERSNKLYEFMAMGIPIIISELPEWAAVINEVGCGLTVNPHDPSDIADKLNYLLRNPVEAQSMGLKGRKAGLEKFSWEKEVQVLLDYYRKLMPLGNQGGGTGEPESQAGEVHD
jgi:glycosyltransferase involved in cell wall biosynthesis